MARPPVESRTAAEQTAPACVFKTKYNDAPPLRIVCAPKPSVKPASTHVSRAPRPSVRDQETLFLLKNRDVLGSELRALEDADVEYQIGRPVK